MFFFLIGGLCLAGFFKMAIGGRRHGRRHGRGRWSRGGPRWRRGLDWAFHRLDTSPGQEKEIRSAVESFLEEAMPSRRELKASMKEGLADILEEDVLDEAALRARMSAQEETLHRVQESLVQTVSRVHAALDSEQRASLRRMIGRFSSNRAAHSGGPFR